MHKSSLILGTFSLLPLTAAHAYIGPGVAAGTIAIVLGILSSIVLAFIGIVWYPIKRLVKRRRGLLPRMGAEDSASGGP